MQVMVKIGRTQWRRADATIDQNGWARVKLPYPYEERIFKIWRRVQKANGKGSKKV